MELSTANYRTENIAYRKDKDGNDIVFVLEVGQYYLIKEYNRLTIYWILDFRAEMEVERQVKDGGNYKLKNQVIYYEMADFEGKEWEVNRHKSIDDFIQYRNPILIGKEIETYFEKSAKFMRGEITTDIYKPEEAEEPESSTALMGTINKQALGVVAAEFESKKMELELLTQFVQLAQDKARMQMEAIKDQMRGALAIFRKELARIYRMIDTIELYLGVSEEIIQIQEGEPAPMETPITFRQRILFMDEEIAVYKMDADFRDLDMFDGWLLENENYKKFIPEKKGMVVFRPRREGKKYSEDPFINALINNNNFKTYFLIRNGENIYRIYAAVEVNPRLFPRREELTKILEDHDRYQTQDEKDVLKHGYQRKAFMLQGLIDRTMIFQPMPKHIKLFDLHESEDLVNFVYDDDENLLSDGRLRFWDWHKHINSKIERGTRVLISGRYSRDESSWYSAEDYIGRLFYSVNKYNAPKLPDAGIYTVELHTEEKWDWLEDYEANIEKAYPGKSPWHLNKIEAEPFRRYFNKETFYILHNPKDQIEKSGWIWLDEPHTRKKRIGWKIYEDDRFVFNYDLVSLEDIEFYLYSGNDRKEYLQMIPFLLKCRKFLLEETKREALFVDFIINEFKKETGSTVKPPFVYEYINWWKKKVIFKRPITKDDAKAFRMIMNEMKRNLGF